jgi:hypothetical protein
MLQGAKAACSLLIINVLRNSFEREATEQTELRFLLFKLFQATVKQAGQGKSRLRLALLRAGLASKSRRRLLDSAGRRHRVLRGAMNQI